MKQHFITYFALFIFTVLLSCMTKQRLIREKFRSLNEKEHVSVVLLGNSLSGRRWLSETNSVQGNYLKEHLGELLGSSKISIINSSTPDDTFNSTKRRVQEDVLSYRPDIVILMIGLLDSYLPGLSDDTFRMQVKDLFDILHKHNTFVIVLTAVGFRDVMPGYDSRLDRLSQFNEIIIWEAGSHNFPVIDAGGYLDRLRIWNPKEYRSMFLDEFLLNEKGQEYIMEYVIKHLNKAYKKRGGNS